MVLIPFLSWKGKTCQAHPLSCVFFLLEEYTQVLRTGNRSFPSLFLESSTRWHSNLVDLACKPLQSKSQLLKYLQRLVSNMCPWQDSENLYI